MRSDISVMKGKRISSTVAVNLDQLRLIRITMR